MKIKGPGALEKTPGKRILVVEDEVAQAAILEEMLTAAGYEVSVATDGYDALEKVVAGSYDLITMDLRMPRLGGLEATALIFHRRDPTPVIIISGYLAEYEKRIAELAGVRHTLSKPIDLEVLLATVKEVLSEH